MPLKDAFPSLNQTFQGFLEINPGKPCPVFRALNLCLKCHLHGTRNFRNSAAKTLNLNPETASQHIPVQPHLFKLIPLQHRRRNPLAKRLRRHKNASLVPQPGVDKGL